MTTTQDLRTWTAHGFTSDITECEQCGKVELKGTVRMIDTDGAVIHAGTTCAAHLAGRPAREITAEARTADKARTAAAARQAWVDEVRTHYATLTTEHLTEIAERFRRDAARDRVAGFNTEMLAAAESELATR
jgi:ribosome-binding protein aMBF1 (putative translation factor)